MEIGEALKLERKRLGLNQTDMAAGILSEGYYSRVENGKTNIRAKDLLDILRIHKIDVTGFLEKLSDNKDNQEKYVFHQLLESFYKRDVKKAVKLDEVIQKGNFSESEKFTSLMIAAILSNEVDRINEKQRKKIIDLLFGNKKWIRDSLALRFFGNSMVLLNDEQLNFYLKQVLDYYFETISDYPMERQRTVVTIMINYLHNIYERSISGYRLESFKFIDEISPLPELAFFKLVGKYYFYLFKKDEDNLERMRKLLNSLGYEKFVKMLPC